MTKKTLQDLQDAACSINGLLDGLILLYDNHDSESVGAMYPIIQHARNLISELNNDLDSVNRDKLHLTVTKADSASKNLIDDDVFRKRLSDAEEMVTDQESLTHALQILLWELCQEQIQRGTGLDKLRSGLIAIGNAMEGLVQTYDEKQNDRHQHAQPKGLEMTEHVAG